MSCAKQAKCASYTRPIRLCACRRNERDSFVFAQALDGRTNKAIASELGVTSQLVTFALKRIYKAHGVSNRYQLLLKCKWQLASELRTEER